MRGLIGQMEAWAIPASFIVTARLNGAHLDVTKQVQRDLQLSKRRENGLSEKTHRHQSSSHMPRTLYQTILGPEFDKVPAEIRRMHSFARVAQGTADVIRGSSWGARLICRLAKLPEARMGVPVETSFEPIVGGERWTRRFDGQPFQTDMMAGKGEAYPCMLERLGPFLFKMQVTASEQGIDITPAEVSLGPLSLPLCLAPRAVGRERVVDGRYSFSVEVTFPLIGKVFGYNGRLQPAVLIDDAETV
ncbi:hypothetical protein ACSSV1_003361 [Labrenzia sp. MBR-25]